MILATLHPAPFLILVALLFIYAGFEVWLYRRG